jgi:carbamoyl-phosphate synthase large subunit
VKIPVFPFRKFPGVDTILGPEMRSTGEVMGMGHDFGVAFWRGMLAEGTGLPLQGTACFSVGDDDKDAIMPAARLLHRYGFPLVATRGTAAAIRAAGLPCEVINKVAEGRPHVVDALLNAEIALLLTTMGAAPAEDSFSMRRTALVQRVPYFTTVSGALAAAHAIAAAHEGSAAAKTLSLQEYHQAPAFDPDSAPTDRVGYR